MTKFKEIWNINEIKYIIINFLKNEKCKWCNKSSEEIYNKKKNVTSFTNSICNDCLIKEYNCFL